MIKFTQFDGFLALFCKLKRRGYVGRQTAPSVGFANTSPRNGGGAKKRGANGDHGCSLRSHPWTVRSFMACLIHSINQRPAGPGGELAR